MKNIIFIALMLNLTGKVLAADSKDAKVNELAFQMSGFTKVSDTKEAMSLKLRDEMSLIISKERFSNQKSAEAFCASQKSTLDKDFNVLTLAISGATNFDPFLKEATTFKITQGKESMTGIWSWAGKDDKIILMADGRGMATEVATSTELSAIMKFAIPAICSKDLKADKKTEKKSTQTLKEVIHAFSQVTSPKKDDDQEVANSPRNKVKEQEATSENNPSSNSATSK